MSKIDINDDDYYFEDEDGIEGSDRVDRASQKKKTQTRRKIENIIERKKLNKWLYTEDSYWEED